MTKKVFELARELNISNKEILTKADELGIKVKTHVSILSDENVKKLRESVQAGKQAAKAKNSVGKPIIDEEYLANKHKSPAGKESAGNVPAGTADAESSEVPDGNAAPAAAVNADAQPEKGKKAADKSEPVKKTKPADKPKKDAADRKNDEKPKKNPAAAVSDKKPVNKPKQEKKEPEIKLADSETIDAPRIKIIKRADPNKKKEEKKPQKSEHRRPERQSKDGGRRSGRDGDRNKDAGRRGSGKKDRGGNRGGSDRRQSQGRGGNAPQASQGGGGSRGGARPAAGGGHSDSKPRHGRKNQKDSNSRTKFEKFERKSLEKKERKKYNKPKQEAVTAVEEEEVLPEGTFKLDVPITVGGFSEQTEISTSKVIMTLMRLGIMANINQTIDEDTLAVLADELGITVVIGEVEEPQVEEGIEDFEDDEKDLRDRPPVITVMGHVDHGKTSLLDAIRKTNVTAKEFGGITQHIGASEVRVNDRKIVCLDTPGHEAFTAMRARGAQITDIAVLVVAADDSVKPQTIESISHAKAAGVPMIVAINKMDKPGANPDMVKKDLADNGILVEDWGGDVICVPVSAKTGEGIKELLEMILLQADMMELKANPNRLALGSVIEARLDKARGPVATLLVNNGTIRAGQSIVAGTCSGRIRLMTDFRGKKIRKAGPATAVEVLGLTDVPEAGDTFNAVEDDHTAREIAQNRADKLREETLARNSSMSLEKLFSQIQQGEVKELNLIIKADVQGSVGALIASLEKLNTDDVRVNVIHSGVGTVNESDIMLAETSDAVILGFNVRPSTAVTSMAERSNVEVRLYTVIYDAINDVEAAMKGMLEPDVKEEMLGKATIRETFKVPGVGIVGGAYVTEGKLARNAEVRLVRDGILIHEGKVSSLKRFKDDAREVMQGYECGIGIEDYNDVKVDDIIECFRMVEVQRD